MAQFTQVATIAQTAQRCKAENIGLSDWQLRSLVKSGQLGFISLGKNRKLINWNTLLQFLESGASYETASEGVKKWQ